jgi:hypothetical protein
MQRPRMGLYKVVHLIILLEGEIVHGDRCVEDVIVLQEEQHGLEEDMLDMFCAECALTLFLANAEEEELVLQ